MEVQILKLSDVAEIVTGSTPPTNNEENYGGEIPFIRPPELNGFSVYDSEINLSKVGATRARLIPKNAVMVCCIGSLGKVAIAGREVATNQQINSLIFNEDILYHRYGFHYCRTLKTLLEHIAPSTTVKIVNKTRFSSLEIPVPPIEEQKRIAAILDKNMRIRLNSRILVKKSDEADSKLLQDLMKMP